MINVTQSDMRKCCECDHAHHAETFTDKEGITHPLWKCGKHKQMITEFTLVSYTCKGVDYKRRGE